MGRLVRNVYTEQLPCWIDRTSNPLWFILCNFLGRRDNTSRLCAYSTRYRLSDTDRRDDILLSIGNILFMYYDVQGGTKKQSDDLTVESQTSQHFKYFRYEFKYKCFKLLFSEI